MSNAKFMNSSILLFLDLIVIAVSGWLYWLVISKLITISEVGQSTSVYSLVVLSGAIIGLGLEYPLLKKTSVEGSKIVGSALLIEIAATIGIVPIMIYTLINFNHNELQSYNLIAAGMLISITLAFVARYALLGISASKTILLVDTISTVIKFVTGYFLVLYGFGSWGVLLSFMLQALVTACITLGLVRRVLGFSTGNFRYILGVIKDGVVNMPSIFSRTLIISLSVVLLASFGVASSDIGVFYIALMISIVAGGLISSTAYMVIPASSMAKSDLSTASIRIGISLTAPIISLLLTSPEIVLSLLGPGYESGQLILVILAAGILPFAIVTNTISRFNYLDMSRKILLVGSLQIAGFIVGFILLVPQFSTMGAALSVLLSYIVSCIPALIWSEKILLRYLLNTILAVVGGLAISNIFGVFIPGGIVNEVTVSLTSVLVTIILIFILKNTTVCEIRTLFKTLVKSTAPERDTKSVDSIE
jgi:O-antigen/teichoic acid export membrane protein